MSIVCFVLLSEVDLAYDVSITDTLDANEFAIDYISNGEVCDVFSWVDTDPLGLRKVESGALVHHQALLDVQVNSFR